MKLPLKTMWLAKFFILKEFLLAAVVVAQDHETVTETASTSPSANSNRNYTRPNSMLSCSSSTIKFDACPSQLECSRLGEECLKCSCDVNCQFGKISKAFCEVPDKINCTGDRQFEKEFTCQFCYQSDESYHTCDEHVDCDSVADPPTRQRTSNCTVPPNLICLGRRHFNKQTLCNWTGGHRWITALALSIALGGFGADRHDLLNRFAHNNSFQCSPCFQVLPRSLARRHRKIVQLWGPRRLDPGRRRAGRNTLRWPRRWLPLYLTVIVNLYLALK